MTFGAPGPGKRGVTCDFWGTWAEASLVSYSDALRQILGGQEVQLPVLCGYGLGPLLESGKCFLLIPLARLMSPSGRRAT